MAFDGPSPFDGDPAFDHVEELAGQPPAAVRAAVVRAFQAVQVPGYIEVDEGVWAWCAVEILATALGRAPDSPLPEPFAGAAARLQDAQGLIEAGIAALEVIGDVERSEVASLWSEGRSGSLAEHLASLRGWLSLLR